MRVLCRSVVHPRPALTRFADLLGGADWYRVSSRHTLMHQDRPSSRSLRAQGLCKVTVLVPEDCAEGIRQFAYELRARYGSAPAQSVSEWRTLSPNVELMVDPERRARCGIRDTRAPGGERFLWSVTLLGHFRTIATGRTAERAEARTLAEAALNGYAADWRELWGGDGSDG